MVFHEKDLAGLVLKTKKSQVLFDDSWYNIQCICGEMFKGIMVKGTYNSTSICPRCKRLYDIDLTVEVKFKKGKNSSGEIAKKVRDEHRKILSEGHEDVIKNSY